MKDRMYVEIDSNSSNESLARIIVAAFLTKLNPTASEIEEVKMAVSEAVTNAVIHGYGEGEGIIYIECFAENDEGVCFMGFTTDGLQHGYMLIRRRL